MKFFGIEKTAGSTTTSKVAAAQPASSALLKMKTGKRKAEKVEKTVKKKCALEEIIDVRNGESCRLKSYHLFVAVRNKKKKSVK